MIKLDVRGTRISICSQEPLTVGLVGETVRFSFDESWNNLGKVVVFRQGQTARDQVLNGPLTKIPWEVLQQPGVPLEIGVYGTNADGRRVIPTRWVRTAPVEPGTDPAGDPALDPTAQPWQQAVGGMGDLQALKTKAKTDLVSAVNEANQIAVDALDKAGCLRFTVLTGEDGSMYIVEGYQLADLEAAHLAGRVLLCHWYDENVVASLLSFQQGTEYVFEAQKGGVQYRIVVRVNGVFRSIRELSLKGEKLTFTGAVEAEYDGTKAVTIPVPAGTSGGGLTVTDDGNGNVTIA